MANEITVSVSVAVSNGNHNETFAASGIRVDQATQGAAGGVVSVGTNVQTLSLGSVSAAGYSGFRNLSTATSGTAYVSLGHYDGTNLQEFCQLKRGDAAALRLVPTITLGAKAYGTATRIRYAVFAE
jgi:hypothetical protein